MNALFEGIYSKFTDGGDFYDNLSGRMYLNIAPQGVTFPYCVFFSVSDLDDLDFVDEREEFLIQFNIFSEDEDATEAGDLFEDLKTMFDDCDLTVTGWRHLYCTRSLTMPNNDFTQDTPIHGYSVEYEVLLEKAR